MSLQNKLVDVVTAVSHYFRDHVSVIDYVSEDDITINKPSKAGDTYQQLQFGDKNDVEAAGYSSFLEFATNTIDLLFYTSLAGATQESMRILGNGKLLLGYQADSDTTFESKLQINGQIKHAPIWKIESIFPLEGDGGTSDSSVPEKDFYRGNYRGLNLGTIKPLRRMVTTLTQKHDAILGTTQYLSLKWLYTSSIDAGEVIDLRVDIFVFKLGNAINGSPAVADIALSCPYTFTGSEVRRGYAEMELGGFPVQEPGTAMQIQVKRGDTTDNGGDDTASASCFKIFDIQLKYQSETTGTINRNDDSGSFYV